MKNFSNFISDLSDSVSVVEKIDFHGVDAVFDALNFAFYPDGMSDEEEIDDRLKAIWVLFLAAVGWTESDYWEEVDTRPCTCDNCGKSLTKDDAAAVLMPTSDQDPDKKLN